MKYLPVLSLVLVACGEATLSEADMNTLRAVTGEEEFTAPDGSFAPVDFEAMPAFRECDAAAHRDELPAGEEANRRGGGAPWMGGDGSRGHGPHGWHLLGWVYDADDSGALDEAERQEMIGDFDERCAVLQQRLVDDFDADGDGQLTGDELDAAFVEIDAGRAAFGGRPEDAERPQPGSAPAPVVAAYDGDGDGSLDEEETTAARAGVRAEIRAGNPPVPVAE